MKFLKTLSVSCALVLLSCSQTEVKLTWPEVTNETKPWTRWWWHGSAVDETNLTVMLEAFDKAGLGGAEITPIYGVHGAENRFQTFLTPQWTDKLVYTLREAKRLGLGIDLANASGWPFGGPWITSEQASKYIVAKTWLLEDGKPLTEPISYRQFPIMRMQGPGAPDQIREDIELPVVAVDTVQTASGEKRIVALFQGNHGKMVERAGPGGEGLVIDHFAQSALDAFLNPFDKAFQGKDLSGLRYYFNDSYEVDDAVGEANWTPAFFEQFKRLRGYDLRDNLAALLGLDSDERNCRVAYDYRLTISDLLLEQYTRPWQQWAAKQGRGIRNQAHGSPANVLDLYAASDVPEVEGDNFINLKAAASASHVTGKKLTASETATWLNEHFLSTMSDVKDNVDKYLLAGVNHVVYHGTAYSPQDAAWPGWLFYAAVHFTPANSLWDEFASLNQYVTRAQSFLQSGQPANDILVYYGLADDWSMPQRPGFVPPLRHAGTNTLFTGLSLGRCAGMLNEAGYSWDGISDKQLCEVETGTKPILIPEMHRMPIETLEALLQKAKSGATVMFYKGLPQTVPGLHNAEAQTKQMNDWLQALPFTEGAVRTAKHGKGKILVGEDLPSMLAIANVQPESMYAQGLQTIRRQKQDGGYYYFIKNAGEDAFAGWVGLNAKFGSAAVYNLMTGESGLTTTRSEQGKKVCYLQLQPRETIVVETFGKTVSGAAYNWYETSGSPIALNNEWQVKFVKGGPTLPPALTMQTLKAWTDYGGDYEIFSGTAEYATTVPAVPADVTTWRLDLGSYADEASVYLNGEFIGSGMANNFIHIPASKLKGNDQLTVRVSNRMANRITDLDKRGVVWRIFYNTNFNPRLPQDRGKDGKFTAERWQPLRAGLTGPVVLIPLKTVVAQPMTDDKQSSIADWINTVGAKQQPSHKSAAKKLPQGDGVTLYTTAIQAAIDSVAALGGGRVELTGGTYPTGSIYVKSNVELYIAKGATLRAVNREECFPDMPTRVAGIEMTWPSAIVNVIGQENVAITGEGTIDGDGKYLWDKYWRMRADYEKRGLRWIVDYDCKRVRSLVVKDSKDVTLSGLTFLRSGFWTVQLLYSSQCTVSGITIRNNTDGHGPSTDGIDVDSSHHILIEDCDIDCNDDNICLKAGRDADGLRVNRPTEYVLIRRCTARKGAGLMTCGSETSGGIRHICCMDSKAIGTGTALRIKSALTRGGTVEHIYMKNVQAENVRNLLNCDMNWNPTYSYSTLPAEYAGTTIPAHWQVMLQQVDPAQGMPHFRHIYMSDIQATRVNDMIRCIGMEQSVIKHVELANLNVKANSFGEVRNTQQLKIENLTLN